MEPLPIRGVVTEETKVPDAELGDESACLSEELVPLSPGDDGVVIRSTVDVTEVAGFLASRTP
jgi:hypothetical protein